MCGINVEAICSFMYGKRLSKISRAESYFRIYTKICSKAEGIKPFTTYSLRSSEMQLHMVIPSTANNDTRNADLKEEFSVVLKDIFTENLVILGDFHLKTPPDSQSTQWYNCCWSLQILSANTIFSTYLLRSNICYSWCLHLFSCILKYNGETSSIPEGDRPQTEGNK